MRYWENPNQYRYNGQRVTDQINLLPVTALLEVGKKVGINDYAIDYYYNPKHKSYYKNEEALRYAMRRAMAVNFADKKCRIAYMLEEKWEERDLDKKYEIHKDKEGKKPVDWEYNNWDIF